MVSKEIIQGRMENIDFMRRTGIQVVAIERGYGRAVMPLKGNENHVASMYIGALTTLAEAGAAVCVSTFLDFDKYFPVVRNIDVDFLKPAMSDVSAEYRLDDVQIEETNQMLSATGRGEYLADFPLLDTTGLEVARARVTITLLSRRD